MKVPLTLVKDQANHVASTRSCGPCTACCVLPRIAVDEGFPEGKPGYTPCNKLCESGCSIYDHRPPVCQSYLCLWRAGIIAGDERRRPDQLGLMFTLDDVRGNIAVEVWELWDNAATENPGKWVIDSIAQKMPVVIRFYGVPVSIMYEHSEHMDLGKNLSLASQHLPQALAEWIEFQEGRGSFGVLTEEEKRSADLDLDLLKRGIPIKRHFRRP